MAEKEIYHVKLHQGGLESSFLTIVWILMMVALWWYVIGPQVTRGSAEAAPYTHDLRSEGEPVEMSFENPWSVMVTVKRPDGDEVRFYDTKTGRLESTFLTPASAEAASDEDESGAE